MRGRSYGVIRVWLFTLLNDAGAKMQMEWCLLLPLLSYTRMVIYILTSESSCTVVPTL